jgi:hypothetical protein
VFYCFAVTTVFQAFFISYLVEPGYEKRINTFDEITDSGLLYGFNHASELAVATMDFTKQNNFTHERRVDCVHLEQCMKRMMISRDITTVNGPVYANYIASALGAGDTSHVMCSVEENIFYISIAALILNGSPLLDGLNSFLRRCSEGGLVDRYWAEINLNARLQPKDKILDEASVLYFVFSISHLRIAFGIYVLGCALNFLVFICEIIHYRFLIAFDLFIFSSIVIHSTYLCSYSSRDTPLIFSIQIFSYSPSLRFKLLVCKAGNLLKR